MTVRIHSIADLDGASEAEIKETMATLEIKRRVTEQMHKQGHKAGITLEEYDKILKKNAGSPSPCSRCDGRGVVYPENPREVGCIHPSSASECRLRLYFDVTGEHAPVRYIKPELQITFAIGHILHAELQAALMASLGPDRFTDEARVDMGLIRGNTDGAITLEYAGAILEIKTDGPSSFPKRRGPDKKHRLQAGALYALGLDKPFIVYLYVEKMWPHAIKEYVEVYDPRIFRSWWKRKGRHVQVGLAEGQEPLADATPSECDSCPYRGPCPQSTSRKGSFKVSPRRRTSR